METEEIKFRILELLRASGQDVPVLEDGTFESSLASRETILDIYSTRLYIVRTRAPHKESIIALFQQLVDFLEKDGSPQIRSISMLEQKFWCFTDTAVTQLYAVFDMREALPHEKT